MGLGTRLVGQHRAWDDTLDGSCLDKTVAGAVLWTGLISASFNYSLELTALGRLPPSEASVILASEPLWAALFAAALYHSPLTMTDMFGGCLIVAACVANATLGPAHFGCTPSSPQTRTSLPGETEPSDDHKQQKTQGSQLIR